MACDKKPEAPFGFKWGQSVSDVKKLKLKEFKVTDDIEGMQFASSDSSPKGVADADSYSLSFLPLNGLYLITMHTKGVDKSTSDGSEGKALYNRISLILEEKYGKPYSVNEKLRGNANNFYACLEEKDCGKWSRKFKRDGVDVEIELRSRGLSSIKSIAMEQGVVSVSYTYLTEEMKKKEQQNYEKTKGLDTKKPAYENY